MKETEVKILEVDRRKIEDTLTKLHAKKIFDGDLQTIFLDFKDNRITNQGNLLRLRTKSEKAELTFKKVKHNQQVKVAQEYSVEVSDQQAMIQILENIGLSVTGKMEKHRLSYKLENAQFDIDQYCGDYSFIPEFLEIEAENISQIHKYAEALGFKPKDCLPWSTEELIQHYNALNEKSEK